MVHLPPPSGVYPVRFDRYSPYFVQAEQYGLNLHPSGFYEFIYPFNSESLANLAYYFTDHNHSAPYLITMIEWSDRIKEKVDSWCARWQGNGQHPAPKLFFKETANGTVIYDSRSSEALEHEVGETGIQLLNLLKERKRLNEIESQLSHISHLDAKKEISLLQAEGLIFEEGGRFLSLVMPENSPLAGNL
jgi:magnesium-protoporphyrin IX monomethyl ester (oxidative) cyclase